MTFSAININLVAQLPVFSYFVRKIKKSNTNLRERSSGDKDGAFWTISAYGFTPFFKNFRKKNYILQLISERP